MIGYTIDSQPFDLLDAHDVGFYVCKYAAKEYLVLGVLFEEEQTEPEEPGGAEEDLGLLVSSRCLLPTKENLRGVLAVLVKLHGSGAKKGSDAFRNAAHGRTNTDSRSSTNATRSFLCRTW